MMLPSFSSRATCESAGSFSYHKKNPDQTQISNQSNLIKSNQIKSNQIKLKIKRMDLKKKMIHQTNLSQFSEKSRLRDSTDRSHCFERSHTRRFVAFEQTFVERGVRLVFGNEIACARRAMRRLLQSSTNQQTV